jgi:hypothetical protein
MLKLGKGLQIQKGSSILDDRKFGSFLVEMERPQSNTAWGLAFL